jgi:hypothetical protein
MIFDTVIAGSHAFFSLGDEAIQSVNMDILHARLLRPPRAYMVLRGYAPAGAPSGLAMTVITLLLQYTRLRIAGLSSPKYDPSLTSRPDRRRLTSG